MCTRLVTAPLALVLGLTPTTPLAQQTLDTEALLAIQQFATEFCGEYLEGGSSSSISVSGEARAELEGFFQKLADFGVEGAASIDADEYVGVLREDLGAELQNARECKLLLWESLRDTVVQQTVRTAPEAPALEESSDVRLWNEDTLQFTLEPGEEHELAGQELYEHVATFPQPSCAGPGFVVYSWLVRDPYPEGGNVSIEMTLMGGMTDKVGRGNSGHVEMGWCDVHRVKNTSINPILVQVRYASAIFE